jgi:hypothetical protein
MKNKTQKFSIIEMSVVLFVIMLLMLIAATFYKTVQRSILIKNQHMEFENIKLAIHGYKQGLRGTKSPATKHVSIYDLIFTHTLLAEHRILILNGKDKTKANEKIPSVFNTPIEVYVTKLKFGSSEADIEAGFKQIPGNEFLTGDFEFYFGNDHEVDGGENGAPPVGTPFGLKGNGSIDDGHQYYYKLIYQEPDNGPKHEFRFH